jgi:3-hydroxybutyryl-CoA dehydrogenase
MRVLVVGAGLMGAQIGCEYALGGHDVTLVARRPQGVRVRVESAFAMLRDLELAAPDDVDAAGARMRFASAIDVPCDLVVESLPEELELKASLLREAVARSPEAVLASNTSSLSITELGELVGAPERTVGTHYWNPPLLMPLVEVVAGERTRPDVLALVRSTLEALGKRPVVVEREVPGFVWNRLQMALLRESLWLVENGVASPETVDEVVRHGLARRYRHVGLFQAIALGGVDTWSGAAANIFPQLSTAQRVSDLRRFVPSDADASTVRERRDHSLARELLDERSDDGRH